MKNYVDWSFFIDANMRTIKAHTTVHWSVYSIGHVVEHNGFFIGSSILFIYNKRKLAWSKFYSTEKIIHMYQHNCHNMNHQKAGLCHFRCVLLCTGTNTKINKIDNFESLNRQITNFLSCILLTHWSIHQIKKIQP